MVGVLSYDGFYVTGIDHQMDTITKWQKDYDDSTV